MSFHGAMLSGDRAASSQIGGLSGLAFALGNGSGVLLLVFFFVAFMAPGHVHAGFVPAHPLFGVDQAAHEPERLSGPISAVWMLLFAIPLFLFTPDRARGTLSCARGPSAGHRLRDRHGAEPQALPQRRALSGRALALQ